MVTFAPFAIFIGVSATTILLFLTFWSRVQIRANDRVKGISALLDRAGIRTRPEDIVVTCLALAALLWFAVVEVTHVPILFGLLLMPVCALIVGVGFYAYVNIRRRRRLDAFSIQLELALRLMASSVRIGLGLRQALATIIDEMPDPARHEYARVIGHTNLGMSPYDALDDLAERMPSSESLMMARVVRIQSQTGGDLGKVLEHLASTIKERRRIGRKIRALTAEGRAGALILSLLPVFLGVFIILTQQRMGHALLYTQAGHTTLLIVLCMEIAGVFTINRILQVKA